MSEWEREREQVGGWEGEMNRVGGGKESEYGMTWKNDQSPEQANGPAVERAKQTLHKHMNKQSKPSSYQICYQNSAAQHRQDSDSLACLNATSAISD